MNITILQGAFFPVPPLLGGAVEKMWFLLGQKFVLRGHKVTHVSKRYDGLPIHENIQGVAHVRVRGFKMPVSLFILKFLDAVYTIRAISAIPKDTDIVVTNSFWAPIILPFLKNAKIYVDVARMPKGQMRLYHKASRLRANSTPVAEAILTELLPKEQYRVSMIPNPLTYEVSTNEKITVNDFSDKRNHVLYCGRIHPEKGIELLTEAANNLPDGWLIKIVGPWEVSQGGGGEGYLKELKASFDLNKVHFLDPIYDINQLNLLYKEAAIFVYPSIAEKGETFGLAPLEAMAWGAVPIVSDLACFKDFIISEHNGLIFNHRVLNAKEELMRCINHLILNIELRNKYAVSALNVNISHSPESIADLFLLDFEKCCHE
jgi:glycosyltransferase involved in cell wall biosynthesis